MTTRILTTCKPFAGEQVQIQRLAFESWLQFVEDPQVYVLGDEEHGVGYHTAKAFGPRANLISTDEIRTARSLGFGYGAPLLDEVVRFGEVVSWPGDLILWINSDIALTQWTADMFRRFLELGKDPFGAACRFNVEHLGLAGPEAGVRERPTGADLFAWPQGWFARAGVVVPPFIIGRFFWDTFLMRTALEHGAPAVDLTVPLHICHPRHERSTHLVGAEAGQKITGSRGRDYNAALFDPERHMGNLSAYYEGWVRLDAPRPRGCPTCKGTGEVGET